MKIEIVRKLNDNDTLIINELANETTIGVKVELLKKALVKLTKDFGQ